MFITISIIIVGTILSLVTLFEKDIKFKKYRNIISSILLTLLIFQIIQVLSDEKYKNILSQNIDTIKLNLTQTIEISDSIRKKSNDFIEYFDSITQKSSEILSEINFIETEIKQELINQNLILKNDYLEKVKKFNERNDIVQYPLYPFTIDIISSIYLSDLSETQKYELRNLINLLENSKSKGWYIDSVFNYSNLDQKDGINFSYKSPNYISKKHNHFSYPLYNKLKFGVVIGIFDKKNLELGQENDGYGTISKSYDSENIISGFIGFKKNYIFHDKDSLVILNIRFKVEEKDVWQNKLKGIVDLQDKYLKMNIYFINDKEIKAFPIYTTIIYQRGKNTEIKFDRNNSINPINESASAFWGLNYFHHITEKDLNL